MASHVEPLESRLFRQSWDDGLLDVFAGVGVVGIGLFWTFDLVALGAVVPALLVPFWNPLRRALVLPRAGLVEFSDARSGHNRRLLIGSGWLGLFMFALFVTSYFLVTPDAGPLLPLVIAGVPAVLLGLLAALAGLGLGLPRFLGYAGLLCVCGVGVVLADARPEVAMIAGGVLVLLNGTWLLGRFLRLEVEDGEAN